MKSFFIPILPAEAIINHSRADGIDLICDFSDKFRKAQYGIRYERIKSNALFDQINMQLNEEYDPFCRVRNDYFFADKLVILDFSDVCKDKKKSENMEKTFLKLYHDGFLIDFGNGECPVRFRYFEHSAGMVRNAKDYFVREDIKKDMEPRIMLDMNVDGITFNPAKYYAYRGLYLTDGWRIDGLELNEETVVVIPDCNKSLPYDIDIITGEKQDDNHLTLSKKTAPAKTERINLFDGQGIISFKYASKINDCLGSKYNQPGKATSFQIRMPFAKGMLHKVDFKTFFEEELCEKPEELFIKDCFGRLRDLSKAEIILTESQFKFKKALEKAYKADDPMKAYFNAFDKYRHALYIHATDLSFNGSNKVYFNYQFINALPTLKSADFKRLIEENIDPLFQLDENGKYLIDFNDAEKIDHIRQALKSYNNGTKAAAVQLNPYFLRLAAVKQELTDYKRSELKKLVSGHVRIDGVQKYITRDLLYFLLYTAKNCELKTSGNERYLKVTDFYEKMLEAESFYLPSEKAFEEGEYYSIFRSPCYSKFEPVLLKYSTAKKDIYEKYFKHLKGCVFIARSSVSISQLGGADQDGDVCKIISNPVINKAVKEYGYNNSDSVSLRSAPVIKIPSVKGEEYIIATELQKGFDKSLTICMKSLFDGFRSSVGRISNVGILLSKADETDDEQIKNMSDFVKDNKDSAVSKRYRDEYIDIKKHIGKVTDKHKTMQEKAGGGNEESDYFSISAYTTIIGGTAIDNAKTGFSPNYEFIIPPKKQTAEYNTMVDKATGKISRFDFHQSYQLDEGESGVYELTNKTKYKTDETLKIYNYDKNVANIDNLPSFFAEHFSRVKDNSAFCLKDDKAPLFKFQKNNEFEKDSEKAEKLNAVVSDYKKYSTFCRYYNNLQKNTNNNTLNQIRKLVLRKYDSYESVLFGETNVVDAIYIAEQCLPSESEEIRKAFYQLKDEGWEFLGNNEEDKKRLVMLTLSNGFSDLNYEEKQALISLLCDFRFDGYKLLPLILKNAYTTENKERKMAEYLDTRSDSELLGEMKRLYMFHKNIVSAESEESDENDSLVDVNASLDEGIKAICRESMEKIFRDERGGFNYLEAIEYCWAMKDHGGSFFWKIFNEDEIRNAVYVI